MSSMHARVASPRLPLGWRPVCSLHVHSVHSGHRRPLAPQISETKLAQSPLGFHSIQQIKSACTSRRRGQAASRICCSYQALQGCLVQQASNGSLTPILSLWEVCLTGSPSFKFLATPTSHSRAFYSMGNKGGSIAALSRQVVCCLPGRATDNMCHDLHDPFCRSQQLGAGAKADQGNPAAARPVNVQVLTNLSVRCIETWLPKRSPSAQNLWVICRPWLAAMSDSAPQELR